MKDVGCGDRTPRPPRRRQRVLKARVVKARTANQRAAAKRYQTHANIVLQPMSAGVPASSWWTQPRSREEFVAAAAEEARRMRESRFGRSWTRELLEG